MTMIAVETEATLDPEGSSIIWPTRWIIAAKPETPMLRGVVEIGSEGSPPGIDKEMLKMPLSHPLGTGPLLRNVALSGSCGSARAAHQVVQILMSQCIKPWMTRSYLVVPLMLQ
jgi:hypothetical protein